MGDLRLTQNQCHRLIATQQHTQVDAPDEDRGNEPALPADCIEWLGIMQVGPGDLAVEGCDPPRADGRLIYRLTQEGVQRGGRQQPVPLLPRIGPSPARRQDLQHAKQRHTHNHPVRPGGTQALVGLQHGQEVRLIGGKQRPQAGAKLVGGPGEKRRDPADVGDYDRSDH